MPVRPLRWVLMFCCGAVRAALSWSAIADGTTVGNRLLGCGYWDSSANRFYVIGGSNNIPVTYLTTTSYTTNLGVSWNAGPGMPGTARAYLKCTTTSANTLILVGGYTGTVALNDVLALSGGVWSTKTSNGTFSGRDSHALVGHPSIATNLYLGGGVERAGSAFYSDVRYRLALCRTIPSPVPRGTDRRVSGVM
jgi:hypothetical protein